LALAFTSTARKGKRSKTRQVSEKEDASIAAGKFSTSFSSLHFYIKMFV
jgi:hypothetical protein